MNRKIIALIISVSVLLVSCQDISTLMPSGNGVTGPAVGGRGTQSLENGSVSGSSVSAMGDVVSGSGIHAADNVTSAMQSADFWIARTNAPDRILMSADEIRAYNKKIREELAASGAGSRFYDLDSYGDTISGTDVKKYISNIDFSAQTYYDKDGKPIAEEKWQGFYDNCALSDIQQSTVPRYGIVCSRADVRALPTNEKVYTDAADRQNDVFQDTALAVNEPVLILQTSRDQEWFYVIAEEYAGWTHADNIGLCSKQEWTAAKNVNRFLVVTADQIEFHAQNGELFTGDYIFSMGTRLALAENKEWQESVSGGSIVRDNYVVKVPVRSGDGTLSYEFLQIPIGRDVHIGYLDYTRGNILTQAFKLLGDPYGWGGSNGERDCSSMVRDIFLCFGLRLPRNSSDIAECGNESSIDLSKLDNTRKVVNIMTAEPGDILQMPGHVMIYLGCQDRNLFVISAAGGAARHVTVNDLHAITSSGQSWLDQMSRIVKIES